MDDRSIFVHPFRSFERQAREDSKGDSKRSENDVVRSGGEEKGGGGKKKGEKNR